MTRIADVDLPREERLEITLTYIYSVGRTRTVETLTTTGISPDLHMRGVTEEGLVKLCEYIDSSFKVEGDLCYKVQADTHRKVGIGPYQGPRYRRSLPVHGQRTKTSTHTRKGPRHTVTGKKRAR